MFIVKNQQFAVFKEWELKLFKDRVFIFIYEKFNPEYNNEEKESFRQYINETVDEAMKNDLKSEREIVNFVLIQLGLD